MNTQATVTPNNQINKRESKAAQGFFTQDAPKPVQANVQSQPVPAFKPVPANSLKSTENVITSVDNSIPKSIDKNTLKHTDKTTHKDNSQTTSIKENNTMKTKEKKVRQARDKKLSPFDLKGMKTPTRYQKKTKRVNLLMPPDLYEEIQDMIELRGVSMNAYIINSVIDTIIKDKQQ